MNQGLMSCAQFFKFPKFCIFYYCINIIIFISKVWPSFWRNISYTKMNFGSLTLAPAGGGGLISTPPPLRFFADSEKTAARSAAKFAIAVQPTI